jgi:hypothetical protein
MVKEISGKIFLVHTNQNIPVVAFSFPNEARRVEKELKNSNIHLLIKEVFCFGNVQQRLFVLMEQGEGGGLVVSFATGKDANCMSKLLSETGNTYFVTEISCFETMREQVLAKYRLKHLNGMFSNNGLNACDNCTMETSFVKKYKE